MFYFSSLAPLATAPFSPALRSPRTRNKVLQDGKSCPTAVYTDPSTEGRNNRFKKGMEPDTADHNIRSAKTYAKRDDGYPKTDVTVGDATVMWDCDVDPVSMLNQLIDVCSSSGQCVTSAPTPKMSPTPSQAKTP